VGIRYSNEPEYLSAAIVQWGDLNHVQHAPTSWMWSTFMRDQIGLWVDAKDQPSYLPHNALLPLDFCNRST